MNEILIKYNGKKIPTMGGKQIFPGNQSVDREAFENHINTPIGKRELKEGIWQIIEEKKADKPVSKEQAFVDLPVSKQKEFVSECFNLNELNELKNIDGIGKTTVKTIESRIEELENDFNYESDK